MKRGLILSVALLAMVVIMTGCTTFYGRWSTLERGMTKAQVLEHMEEDPNIMNLDANGNGDVIWRADRPQAAIATFKNGKLVEVERYKIE